MVTGFGKNRSFVVISLLILGVVLAACTPDVSQLEERRDIPGLIEILHDEEEDVTRQITAVEALGNLGKPEATASLIQYLSKPDEDMRLAAIRALGQIGDPDAIQPLISALRDESQTVQEAAQQVLTQYGDSAVPQLTEALKSHYPEFRTRLIAILSQSGRSAIPVFVEALSNPVEAVRLGVNEVLVNIGSPAIPYLMAAISAENSELNDTLVDILITTGEDAVPALMALLNHENGEVRERAFDALVEMEEAAIEPLVEALDEEDTYGLLPEVILAIGEPGIDTLINALYQPAFNEKAGDILIAMGLKAVDPLVEAYNADPIRYAELMRPLINALTFPNAVALNKIKTTLVSIGEPAVPDIIALVKNANSVAYDETVIYANAMLEGPNGQAEGELAIGGLCDSVGNWKGKIVLCKRGDIYFYEKIQNVQAGGGKGVILYNNIPGALQATLGDEVDARIVSVVVSEEEGTALLEEAFESVVQIKSLDISAAMETVIDIGEPAIPHILDALREDTLYNFAEDVLIAIGTPSVDPLIGLLDDKDEAFRTRVVYTLGRIGGTSVIQPIIGMLEDSSADVRWEAAYALADLQPIEAVDPLIGRLEDEDQFVQEAARDALIAIGLPAVDPLLDYYHTEGAEQPGAAEYALREIFDDISQPVLEVAIKVCSGEGYENAAPYQRYESDIHPMVILTSNNGISSWMDDLPVDWLPFTPDKLELVVCLGAQEQKVVQVCRYYYTGTGGAAPSTTRYRYEQIVSLYVAQTGVRISSQTFRGSNPGYCPYQKSGSLSSITGDYVQRSDIVKWLKAYGIPLPE